MEQIISHLQEFGGAYAVQGMIGLLILLAAILVGHFAGRAAERALCRRGHAALASLGRGTVRIAIMVVGVVMALDQVGVSVTALLAGAGVFGLAIGFGAQSLVKDLISGFFLLLSSALRPGDVANVGKATGFVEEVGLRQSKIRAFNGQLWYVPNGEITVVGNFSRSWCRAVVEVGLAYEQDVADGLRVLQEVGNTLAEELGEIVLEPPEAQGVLGLDDSSVTVRLVMKVKAGEQWGIERKLRHRIKAAFDASGVEIPFPRRVVYHRQEADAGFSLIDGRGKESDRSAA